MDKQICQLPNGCTLYRRKNEVGYTYYSDEVGCDVIVWDTALVDESTLLCAIVEEEKRRNSELYNKYKTSTNNKQSKRNRALRKPFELGKT